MVSGVDPGGAGFCGPGEAEICALALPSVSENHLQLDEALIAEAKVVAARAGRTLSQVIED
jgi:hypothetical protein